MLKYHIQTIELGASGASTISFNSIPQTFTDLVIRLSLRSTRTGFPSATYISFNSTGYNSAGRVFYATGSDRGSYGFTDGTIGAVSSAASTSNTFSNSEIYIPNYSSSGSKSYSVDYVFENNATAAEMGIIAGVWANSAPITNIDIDDFSTNSFVQYSSASLYGIRRGSDGATGVSPVATGGTVTTSGGYTIHTFTSSGTFAVNRNVEVDCLVIAGGGAGGSNIGGGGGAGGYRAFTGLPLSGATSYTVTVGAGGARQGEQLRGLSGASSTFGAITSTGGGGGAGNSGGTETALTGGSGGGGAYGNITAAAGNAGGFSPAEGNSGGNGISSTFGAGGGGGGASAAGTAGSPTADQGSQGGNGTASSITGTSVTRAGGGGGGRTQGGTTSAAIGGTGGGGNGGFGTSPNSATDPTAGASNTGSGGGGAGWGSGELGANGGSGVVIIRYLTPA